MHADDADRYFDYAASAPPLAEALAAQTEAALQWPGNPSSAHRPGTAARTELERLRTTLAGMCNFMDGRVVLTSGATEANNCVIQGVLGTTGPDRVLVAADVHASIWNPCRRYPGRMDVLPLDSKGRIQLAALTTALRPETRLVCLSHVASETGLIQDVGAIASICERRGILCHVDGAQALGRIPVNLSTIACDFYTFSSHKFGGPRGCGGIFARSPGLTPLMAGGAQEGGLRPGTENLPGIAGTVVALNHALTLMPSETPRLRALTQALLSELEQARVLFLVNGDPDVTAPGFVSVTFPTLDGHSLAADLAVQGFAIATGSACSANRPEPSRTILALGRSPADALGTIRISFGRTTRPEAVATFTQTLIQTVRRHTGQRG